MGKQLDSQLRGYANAPEKMKKDPTYPIFKEGMRRGKEVIKYEVLTFLENKYVHDEDRPERGSDEAKYLLGLVTELTSFINTLSVD